MNRWYQLRRMRGALFLILVGVLALLNQWHIMSWGQSWPFFLIVPGLLALAERAAWTADARAQQAAQAAGAFTGPGTGTVGTGSVPVGSAGPSAGQADVSWSAPSSSEAAEKSFVQPYPTAAEDANREDR